jgi:spermidine synthase
MVWLAETRDEPYDVIIVDFPDPNNFSLGKLYTTRFYRLLQNLMHDDSAVVVQASSPLLARQSFWCIERTMAAAGLSTRGYHALVPSFGVWGYVLAMPRPFREPSHLALTGLRFLNDDVLASMFVFPEDMGRVPVEPNRLNNQHLVRYYESEWAMWN